MPATYTDKSYVSLEQQICPVCGKTHDTGAIVMDDRLRDRFDHYTVTGYGLCPEHQQLFDEGYLHLVVAESPHKGSSLHIEDAIRTGEIISIKQDVARQIFNVDFPDDLPMTFIDPEAVKALKGMVRNEE